MKRTLAAVSLAACMMAGLAVLGVTLADAAPHAQWSRQPLAGFVTVSGPSEAVEAVTATPVPTATPAPSTSPTPQPTPDPTRSPKPIVVPESVVHAVTTRTIFTRTPPPPPPAKAPVVTSGGASVAQAQAFALSQVGSAQYSCVYAIWVRESSWNPFARNRLSGAYGIPQALPGVKMAAYGADWAWNPVTQVRWGLAYIRARYGTPCAAWAFWQAHRWY